MKNIFRADSFSIRNSNSRTSNGLKSNIFRCDLEIQLPLCYYLFKVPTKLGWIKKQWNSFLFNLNNIKFSNRLEANLHNKSLHLPWLGKFSSCMGFISLQICLEYFLSNKIFKCHIKWDWKKWFDRRQSSLPHRIWKNRATQSNMNLFKLSQKDFFT